MYTSPGKEKREKERKNKDKIFSITVYSYIIFSSKKENKV
jgi:hypothetical protein